MPDLVSHIGFPPPLLGAKPQRLPVLYQNEELIALLKPTGVTLASHRWYPDWPNLTQVINCQSQADKPELKRLQIDKISPVFLLDPEISGVALWAKSTDMIAFYRNQLGSSFMRFHFVFIASQDATTLSERECDLPVAEHCSERRMLISHKTGKRAKTLFQPLQPIDAYPSYYLWEAVTAYPRLHQIRLHAFESGLFMPGENCYMKRQKQLSTSRRHHRLKLQKISNKLLPSTHFLCLYLSHIDLSLSDGRNVTIVAPIPLQMKRFIRKASPIKQG